jgi:hypothetical protein
MSQNPEYNFNDILKEFSNLEITEPSNDWDAKFQQRLNMLHAKKNSFKKYTFLAIFMLAINISFLLFFTKPHQQNDRTSGREENISNQILITDFSPPH